MFKSLFLVCFSLIIISFTQTTDAKIFRNAYVSFELPETWKCVLEHTEWVCRSEIDKESKEAIIILTAKEVGPTDSFEAYIQHLNTPQSNSGKTAGVPSKIIYPPKKVQINDHTWIDGLHMASEVPNYFTRYLATIKDKVAVLVTFSAHKNHYTRYSQDFFKAVQSLRVIASKNLLGRPDTPLRPGQETLGAPINTAMPGNLDGVEPMPDTNSSSSGTDKTKALLIFIALALAAAALFVFLKMKK